MKLLLDQNLSRFLVRRLSDEYPDSVHVVDVGLAGATDQALWEYATDHDLVIVSKDSDFRQMAFLFGPPPHVVWLRVGNAPTSVVETLLREKVTEIADFATSVDASLLVLTP